MAFPFSKKAQQVIAGNTKTLAEVAAIDPTTLAGYIIATMEIDPLTGELSTLVRSGGSLEVREEMMRAIDDHGPTNPNTHVVASYGADADDTNVKEQP